ncbi:MULTISPECIES: amidohydrolase family protein [unclassified Imperialibacter]|uniref:metal-dependent hydrolase family protein n=1 Tax=unclassified Imperialibacter TaxID=2629706 RepID=UPI0012575FA1|nr:MULTISPECIES: amidohydrolase family protein [unclassified Imperialibacter]CAD5268722.1 Amidohydrolase [Imperialibacter sp. 89]CAD5297109.1 Amidohydrolase [Imperialibacter sp. 75]VVT34030.1 Amidohydrolase [Imperialibacter sp. EC-SDR9]
MLIQKYFKIFFYLLAVLCLNAGVSHAQSLLLKPDRVFDGEKTLATGTVVLVEDGRVAYVGPESGAKAGKNTKTRTLPGQTLLPGLIEGHSHVLLHPYNEVSWNDQVLKESTAERVARGTVHLQKSLEAGITTMRDLGSEGAGYADVGLRTALEKGIIQGPTLLVAGPAIVATGSYGPKGFHEGVTVPLGAETADGHDDLIKVVRDQIGKGADLIKVYADYRWGLNNKAAPTFTLGELKLIVEVAESSGRQVVAHASTKEGMRRAILAGVKTIEHGDDLDEEIVKLMKEHGVALCPTLGAVEAIASYGGWKKGTDADTDRIEKKKASMTLALTSGIDILFGGDVGVFSHGNNVYELELMNEYGMSAIACLQSATSLNAKVFGIDDKVGKIQKGLVADLVAVEGDPSKNISDLRKVELVVQAGRLVVEK